MTVRADPGAQADRSATGAVMLRRILLIDAVTSGAVGLLMLAAAPGLSELWDFPSLLLRITGVAMVLWGVGLIELCRRGTIPSGAVRGVIVANWSWFAASVLLLVSDWVEPTESGFAFVACQAAIVAVFAILQGRFLRLRPVG